MEGQRIEKKNHEEEIMWKKEGERKMARKKDMNENEERDIEQRRNDTEHC